MTITYERLREIATYDPKTGEWSGKLSRYGAPKYLYNRIYIDGKQYRSSRLAFFYMTGRWPTEIDHINHDRFDDRWENLREASREQNLANRRKFGSSGLPKGVHRYGHKYKAACGHKGKEIHLGYFDTAEEASLAYQNMVKTIHAEYAYLE